MLVNILAVGDVCGENGLEYLERNLRKLRKLHNIGFAVVNGENANVVGVTPAQCDRILAAGADCVTLGNHTWTRWELRPYLDESAKVIRPANCAPQCPGKGYAVFPTPFGKVLVVNLMGRFTLDTNTDNPFVIVDNVLEEAGDCALRLVDFHAEATSEKQAMGYFMDGRVSAVWGTHTHVQTSDARVLPEGTGYITDVGMTGPMESVLGIDIDQSIGKFLGDPPQRYKTGKSPCRIECCVFTADTETGKCTAAEAMRVL